MGRPNVLAENGQIFSNLWIDQTNAPEKIANKLAEGLITAEEAERLRKIWEDGYVIFPSGLPESVLDAAVENAHNLWQNRPQDLLAAASGLNQGRPMSMVHFPDDFSPLPGTRILDAHSHNPQFAELVSLPVLHRFVTLLLEEKPVVTQSLYFQYGSTQRLHRDPWYVVTTPLASLFAAWIALEDITEESGPLSFVPQSHRMPFKPLNTGDIVFHDPTSTEESRNEHVQDMHARMASEGYKTKKFLAKKGEILVWHGSLIHGGSSTKGSPPPTRESLVVHFDALVNRKDVAQSLRLNGRRLGGVVTTVVHDTPTGAYFENPAFGKNIKDMKPL